MTDPWAIPYQNHLATTALQKLVEDEPDRVTGMWMDERQDLVLSVVDHSVLDEAPFARILEAAAAAGMTVTVVPGARSRRELERISDEVRQTPLRSLGAHGYSWGIDPITATVPIRVGASVADAVRAAFAHHGDAVVVVASPPADLTPRHARGTPLMELVGQPVKPTAARLRDEGRDVEIHHLGHPVFLNLNLNRNRIRLFVHDDLVRDASRG